MSNERSEETSPEPMQVAASGTSPGHTAASHQISPHALRNDGAIGQNVNDKNNNILQQKTTTSLMSTPEKDEYEKRITADSQNGYITLQQAMDIAEENRKTDKTQKSKYQLNLLRTMIHNKKWPSAFKRTLLKEADLQLHPTDRNLFLPCHASMNDPVVVTKYRHAPVYPRWP